MGPDGRPGTRLGLGGVGGVAGQALGEGYSLGSSMGSCPLTAGPGAGGDKIALILMAKAGYDPALVMDFWRRLMTDEYVKLCPPQFLTAHPRTTATCRPWWISGPGAEALCAGGGNSSGAFSAPAATPAPAPPLRMLPKPAPAPQPTPNPPRTTWN